MELTVAADKFAALGSDARLQVLKILVRAGEPGLTVGDIQSRTGISPSTLAHHLRHLTSSGLVTQERAGRSTINRASFDQLSELASYILVECCAEQSERAA